MKKTKIKILLFVLAALSICSSQAVSQQYLSQDGRLLDANARIGSMGLNSPARLDALMPRAGLYITGNVTGGASFQGLVPYRSPYEFNASLGSSLLSDFRRDSVGLQDIYSSTGRKVGPSAYLDPARAISTTVGNRVVSTGADRSITPPITTIGSMLFHRNDYAEDDLVVRPLSRSHSGLNVSSRIGELSSDLLAPPDRPKWMNASTEIPPPAGALDIFDINKTYWSDRRPDQTEIAQETPEDQAETTEPYDQLGKEPQQPIDPIDPDRIFSQQPTSAPQRLGHSVPPAEQTDQEETPGEARQVNPDELAGPARQRTSMDRVPAYDLAAKEAQMFEKHMQKGEQLLRAGQYYRAANAFDAALMYINHQPRAYLAKSHALLAAGEFMSAAFFLNRSLEIEPELAELRVDLTKIFSDTKKLDDRLAELSQWQERSKQPILLFLKGYIQLNLGDTDSAKKSLAGSIEQMPDAPAPRRLLEAANMAASPDSIQKDEL